VALPVAVFNAGTHFQPIPGARRITFACSTGVDIPVCHPVPYSAGRRCRALCHTLLGTATLALAVRRIANANTLAPKSHRLFEAQLARHNGEWLRLKRTWRKRGQTPKRRQVAERRTALKDTRGKRATQRRTGGGRLASTGEHRTQQEAEQRPQSGRTGRTGAGTGGLIVLRGGTRHNRQTTASIQSNNRIVGRLTG
jgi:hypothetical protein